MTKCTPKSLYFWRRPGPRTAAQMAANRIKRWPGLSLWCTRGVSATCGTRIDTLSSVWEIQWKLETQLRNIISRIDPCDYIRTHDCWSKVTCAAPRWRPKTPTLASSTNYTIQAVQAVEAEGGTKSRSNKINNKS